MAKKAKAAVQAVELSKKAQILKKLYDAGKVSAEGLQKAVSDGVITEAEYKEITEAN